VAQLLQAMELEDRPATDEGLLAWLEGSSGELTLRWQGRELAVERLAANEAPQRFGFVQRPDQLAAPK
jgi:hypothetical protein